jgi:biotin carboxyl carrier protein
MDIRKVKKLIELLEESGIAEIEIKEGEEAVRISRMPTGAPAPQYYAAPPPVAAAPAAAPAAAAAPSSHARRKDDENIVPAPHARQSRHRQPRRNRAAHPARLQANWASRPSPCIPPPTAT